MFVFEFTSPKMPLISYFFFTNVSSDFLIKFVLTKKVYCCIKDACHFLSEGTSNTLNKVKSFQLSQHLTEMITTGRSGPLRKWNKAFLRL